MERPEWNGFRQQPQWGLALLCVVAGQALLGLALFGPSPWAALHDNRAVICGRHPLHLYHGTLGALTFRERQTTSCYDPAFQAGYPKTPVFDGGSRPAELALFLLPHLSPAAAYKWALLACGILAPLAFACSARGAGGTPRAAVLAAALGTLAWWTPPVRTLFDHGDVDLLLAGLCGVVGVGALARYHREPGPTAWMILAAVGIFGWYAHPVVWLGLAPILCVYYLALAPRHGPAWHVGLLATLLIGFACNGWWLTDWGRFWWLREQTALAESPSPPHPSDVAADPAGLLALLGTGPMGWVSTLLGLAACVVLARTKRRTSAWLYAGTIACMVILARIGQLWPPVQMLGFERVATLACGMALVPMAIALATWWQRATLGAIPTFALTLTPLAVAFLPSNPFLALSPLPLGLNPQQQQIVQALETHTTADARILLEEPPASSPGWNWTALLPTFTGRAFLGGLDGGACVEHGYCGLKNGRLADRAISGWTHDELTQYCRTYNVGWVLARTETSIQRWQAYPGAVVVERLQEDGPVVLFAINRPKSYVLAGRATVDHANRQQLVLTDVEPGPDGTVLLSFHYQPGMQIAPSLVYAEPAKDVNDPIPLLRLRVAAPAVSRVTVRWENR